MTNKPWDYLILSAANDQQAQSYEFQLRRRQDVGALSRVRRYMVIADVGGKRMGSGGSTLHCLVQLLEREGSGDGVGSFDECRAVLSGLRILIVHAGGDSRRLPAYSHCGKMFVPLPDKAGDLPASTLFDRLVPTLLSLPEGREGQIVIASGDALILFDPASLDLTRPGITALGMWAPAHASADHGVFCARRDGCVERYLQKPSPDEQSQAGAVNQAGQSVLDLGVMSCDTAAAIQMMRTFFTEAAHSDSRPGLVWKTQALEALQSHGIDLYREICCAMGSGPIFEASCNQYFSNLRTGGLCLETETAAEWFRSLHEIPLFVSILPEAKFLHFGTTRQLLTSGLALLQHDSGELTETPFILNSEVHGGVVAKGAWIEGCAIEAAVLLEGSNVVVGADITRPLTLPEGACFDLAAGISRHNEAIWFWRFYDIDDSFKHTADAGGTLCALPLGQWLNEMGGHASDIWSSELSAEERTLWNAQVFPALKDRQDFREWLWLFHPRSATAQQKGDFWAAERYRSSEIAIRVDQSQFYARRQVMRFKRFAQ